MASTAAPLIQFSALSVSCVAGLLLLLSLARIIYLLRRRKQETRLRGPTSPSRLLGFMRVLHENEVKGQGVDLHIRWAKQFGGVYELPYPLDTTVYAQTELQRTVVEMLSGKNLMYVEGDSHTKQRRTMAPSFGNAALRDMAPIFEKHAEQLKTEWETVIGSKEYAILDVGEWMNRVSLDNIGAAGFSHDFNALASVQSPVYTIFNAFNGQHSLGSLLVFLFAPTIPALWRLPTQFRRLADKFAEASRDLAHNLLSKTQAEEVGVDSTSQKSVIATLIRAQSQSDGALTQDEISAQIQFLLLAAYDTTSTVLTWALVLLAQHPHCQTRLRAELASDASSHSSSYLDAVVHETIRLYPPLPELTRVATQDDVIPLSEPVFTVDGRLVDQVHVRQGTVLLLPLEYINQRSALWGEDAGDFRPERWLSDGLATSGRARAQGYRGILSFSHGSRTCLGKNFALQEIKAVLSLLLAHFSFEMVEGMRTAVGRHRTMVSRPTLLGSHDARMPMIVRRLAW